MKILLDFDDGWESHYTKVAPLLSEYEFPATFFINIRCIEAHPYFMGWNQIVDVHFNGFTIGNHLNHHIDMTKATEEVLRKEIADCEIALEEHSIPKPIVLAYPGFHCNEEVKKVVADSGYALARAGLGIPEEEYLRGGSGDDYRGDQLEVNCKGVFGLDYGFDEFRRDLDEVRNIGVFVFHDLDTEHDRKDIHTTYGAFHKCMGYLKESGIEVVDYASIV